jgi:hypothetical protein
MMGARDGQKPNYNDELGECWGLRDGKRLF